MNRANTSGRNFRCAVVAALALASLVHAQAALTAEAVGSGNVSPTQPPAAAIMPWAVPATMLMGMPVVSQGNEEVGVVRDLLIDTESGRARYAIVALVPGVRGADGKALAFPLTRLQPLGGNAPYALVASLPRSSLAHAPGFDADRWPDFNRDPYRARAASYFFGSPSAFRDQPLVLASRIFGGEVLESLDTVYQDDIGVIRDLGIDLAGGRVRYMVVEYDPGWNSPDRFAIIPREDLSWEDDEAGGIAYETSRYDLRRAPAVAKARWPQIALETTFRKNYEEYVRAR